MRTGRIKYFVTKTRRPVFPVTRAEAVICGNTTLDRKLAEHDGKIGELREDVEDITSITNAQIDERIFNTKKG